MILHQQSKPNNESGREEGVVDMWCTLSLVPGGFCFVGIISSLDSGSSDLDSLVTVPLGGGFKETYLRVANLKGLNSQVCHLFSNFA